MARTDQTEIILRILILRPVAGVLHSLQAKDGTPLDPKAARDGQPLAFDFAIRLGPGGKLLGDQVRREGAQRRFVYIRIGQLAGEAASPWSRRMKIDVHDMPPELLERAARGGVIEMIIDGTAEDGTPACATLRPVERRFVEN